MKDRLLNSSNENPFEEINPAEETQNYLTGWWEKKNRNITAAAVAGMIGIGALYFNVQSVLITVFVLVYKIFVHVEVHADNFLDRMRAITSELKPPLIVALVISQYVFMLLPTLWITKKWHTPKIGKYLRIKFYSFKEIILAVLITVSFIPACNYITYILVKALKIPDVFTDIGSELFTAHSGGEFLILVLVVAVTPAICEELFFRGYIQRTFERKLGWKSFLLTGFLFGLFHMQPLGLITLSLLGILFSFFYYRTKSIFTSSAAHFTNNFIAIGMLYFGSGSNELSEISDGGFPILWVIISLFIGIGLLMIFINVTRNNDREKDEMGPPMEEATEILNV